MKSTTHFKKNKKATKCLNCEESLNIEDNFCPNCSQVNDLNRLSLKQYFSEYLSGFFSFDNRFAKTVFPLIFKPGFVTTEYVEGKRKKYVSPFQLYLNITILFFLFTGLLSSFDEYNNLNTTKNKDDIETAVESIQTDSIVNASKEEILKNLNTVIPDNNGQDSIKSDLLNIHLGLDDIPNLNANDSIVEEHFEEFNSYIVSYYLNSNYLDALKSDDITQYQKDSIFKTIHKSYTAKTLDLLNLKEPIAVLDINSQDQFNKLLNYSTSISDSIFKSNGLTYKAPEPISNSSSNSVNFSNKKINSFFNKMKEFIEFDKKHTEIETLQALDSLNYPTSKRNAFLYKKAKNINKLIADPDEEVNKYLKTIVGKISVALFFLLPIFTIFVALLYIGNKNNYTEHLVFVFHTQTFFFISLFVFILFDRIFNTDLGIMLFIVLFLFYLYKAMRNFYKQSRFVTFLKHTILNFIYLVLATIGFTIVSFIAFIF